MRITIYVVFLLLNHMKETTCGLTVRVCGLLLMLCTPFGAAIPLSSFYPYGSAAGDTLMPSIDDGSSSAISLPTPFMFFGTSYTSIFVNTNGDLTFNASYSGYSSQPFPIQGKALIAPFFADVDTRGTGKVWYRATTDSALLAKAVNDIQSGQNFTAPSWLLIATWDHVGYYRSRTDKTNTFQCILTTDTVQSYAIFQYADGLIQWTTGDASGGVGGLGGTPAQVGCNAGNGAVNYVTVPASRTPAIINITSTSNVLVPGQWIFSVQDAVIVASSPLNFSLSPVPQSPYQLSAMWSAPSVTYGNITAYTVYCNTSATQAYSEQIIGPNIPTIRSVVNGATLATVFSIRITPYTQYDCYVTANTSVGEGTPSQIVTARTDQSTPSSPLNLSVSTVPGSPNQLSASWSPPIPKNGIITAYTVYCNTSASQAYPEQVIGPNVPTVRSAVNGTTLAVTFNTGLKPYTQYNCYVTANTSVGEGTPSQIHANTTDQSLPGPVPVLKQISSTFTTVTLVWLPPVVPNGAIIGYEVILGSIVIYNTSSTQAVLPGLTVSMSYNLSVVALTVKGSGQPTYLQATTLSIPLVPITLLQPLSSTSVRLFWNVTLGVPQNTLLGFVVHYRSKRSVKWQSGGVETQTFPPNATNGDISGLVPNYNYYEFSVQAILNISGQPTVLSPQSYASLSNLTILTPAPMEQTSSHTIITALGATLATLVVVLLILMVVAVIVTILVMRRKGHRIQQYNISIKQPDHVTASTELNVVENNYTMKPIIHHDRTLSF